MHEDPGVARVAESTCLEATTGPQGSSRKSRGGRSRSTTVVGEDGAMLTWEVGLDNFDGSWGWSSNSDGEKVHE